MVSEETANVASILSALESLTDGFWMVDAQWRVTYVNAEAERSSKHTKAEMLGRTLWETFPDTVGTELEIRYRRAAAERITLEFEYFYAPVRRWFGIKVFPTTDGGMAFITRDITKAKVTEKQVTSLMQRLDTLVDNTPMAVIEWDADFVVTRWAGQAENVFGWSASEVVGRRIDAFPIVYEEDRGKVEFTMAQLLDPVNRFVVSRNRNRTRDGKVISCEWYNSVLHDEAGRLIAVLSMVLDVTDRNRATDDLRYQRDLTSNITDNATTAIFMTDENGRCSFMNPAAEAMTGFSFAELKGQVLHDFIHHHHPDGRVYPSEECPSTQASLGFEAVNRTETFIRKNGEFFPVLVNAKQINAGGRGRGTVIEVRDVTEQVRADQALRHADRRKDEFLATLAHELRNPLAPIRSSLDLLNRGRGNPTLLDQARSTMERQVGQMVRLVDDLLDVSRITLDKIELRKERVELATVLKQALESSRPTCSESIHELRVNVPGDPIYVHADPVRLTQVFSNLLINSCKYTGQGGQISLTARCEDTHVAVSVKDTGCGIPPEMLSRVFDLFTQVDRKLEHTTGGLGIGLSLAKRLVHMHGGTIEARSEGEGQGCEFITRLPMLVDAKPAAPPAPAVPPIPNRARRILVVDDNLDAADTLAELLRMCGNEASVAHDGVEALEALEQERPEIVLLDIGLPKLNGREVCRRAREQDWSKSMVFVAVTGWGQADDRRQSKEAGFDAHLTKPVSFDALMKLVDTLHPATQDH